MTAITANVLVAVEPVVPAALPYEKTNEHYGEGGGRRDILLRAEAPTPTSNCGVEKHGRILGVLHDGGRVDSLPLVQLRGFLAREESHGRLVNSSSRHLYSVRDVAMHRPVENHKVNAELIFAAIHAKGFDSESDIQVQVRAWNFHFDCFFDSD